MSIGQFRKKIELIIFSHKIKQMKHLALEKWQLANRKIMI
jgi:hypothetical protein